MLLGVPLFFLTRPSLGGSAATCLMILFMLPFFLTAFYKHNGEPLERYVWHLIQTRLLRKTERPYRTSNIYEALEKQHRYEEEVRRLVEKEKRKMADRKK